VEIMCGSKMRPRYHHSWLKWRSIRTFICLVQLSMTTGQSTIKELGSSQWKKNVGKRGCS
jgi:hypothetical protein